MTTNLRARLLRGGAGGLAIKPLPSPAPSWS